MLAQDRVWQLNTCAVHHCQHCAKWLGTLHLVGQDGRDAADMELIRRACNVAGVIAYDVNVLETPLQEVLLKRGWYIGIQIGLRNKLVHLSLPVSISPALHDVQAAQLHALQKRMPG